VIVRSGLVVAVSTLALAWQTPQQTPTFRARREIVRVDVLVTDHGKPVTGLRPEDFEVRDNGVPQTVELALADETPVNAILALDMSDSVAGERLNQLRDAGRSLIGALKGDDRAALIGFSHIVRLRAGLTADLPSVARALAETGGGGGTALHDAGYAGVVMGETDEGRSLVIVFSDGVDTSSWLTAAAVHDAARRADTVVYGVAVTGSVSAFLKDLTAETGGSVIEVQSTKNLDAVFLRVLAEFRQRYLVSYSLKDVPKGGWHRLDVRVRNRRDFVVKARPGYLTGTNDHN
jgi:VWFA-related protein